MKWFLVLLCVAVMVLGLFVEVFAPHSYSGKETFHTEQEYTLFKEAVASSDVHIHRMQSLSSEPPIIVNFVITVSRDVAFPYGKRGNPMQPLGYGMIGLSFVGLYFVLQKQATD